LQIFARDAQGILGIKVRKRIGGSREGNGGKLDGSVRDDEKDIIIMKVGVANL
jgi:hypothetical protein